MQGGATVTTDYNALDTAALVAAADALTAGITPGEWAWDDGLITTHDDNDRLVFVAAGTYDGDINIDDDDAAFIAAAPALVKALVARLREEAMFPPAPLFKIGDVVTVKFWEIGSPEDWVDGQSLKVTAQEHDPLEEQWWYTVTDGTVSRKVAESGLEPVTNG
jgi:hypothetical protein